MASTIHCESCGMMIKSNMDPEGEGWRLLDLGGHDCGEDTCVCEPAYLGDGWFCPECAEEQDDE